MTTTTKQTIQELQSVEPTRVIERLTLPIQVGILIEQQVCASIRLICEEVQLDYQLRNLGGWLTKTYFLEIKNLTATEGLTVIRELQNLLEDM